MPIDRLPPMHSYLCALSYAKLVHHNFHLLYYQGFQKIGTAARTLLKEQSEGNLPSLVKDCRAGWLESEEIRREIRRNILGRRRLANDSDVENAFKVLWTTEPKTARWIASSYGSFVTIKDNLDKFQSQHTIFLNCFTRDRNLDSGKIMQFPIATNDLMITTERLLSNADAMIRNLIEALQVDTRL